MLWLGADKTLLGFDARQFAQLLNDLFEELVLLLQFVKLRHFYAMRYRPLKSGWSGLMKRLAECR